MRLSPLLCELFVAGAVIGPVAGQSSSAYGPGARPKFGVASVKPCLPHTDPGTDAGGVNRGGVAFRCQTLMDYVRFAYGRFANGQFVRGGMIQIEGGPAWANTELYEIIAKAEGTPPVGTIAGPMMQALLEDRFNLKIHKETRQVPVYALVARKRGVRLPAAKVGCFALSPGNPIPRPKPAQTLPPICGLGKRDTDGIAVHGSTMADFCVALSRMALRLDRRRFIDKTGLAGQFDFDLKFPPNDTSPYMEPGASAAPETRSSPEDDFWRLKGALWTVGLKLVPTIGPGEVLVIDHVERPTAN